MDYTGFVSRNGGKMINVSILGYGTIGSGVFQVLKENCQIIAERTGEEIKVKSILDLRDFPGDEAEGIIVHDFKEIDNDGSIQIVVETMGGLHPAYEFVKASLEKGRSVCTSNKALVAAFGPELVRIAEEKKCNFLFEASVGGGIPIIRPLKSSIAPDAVEQISGILNGTTNYILTEMTENGTDFETVLKDAQAKGYAEKDPTADIEGHDACRKIAILASLAYGHQVDFEDIYTEGITKITNRDINYAVKLGAKIKLVASCRMQDGKVCAMVTPKLVTAANPLYSVDGVFNAILVRGNMAGDIMFYGQGAGKLATASAVVSDIMEAAKHPGINIKTIWDDKKLGLVPSGESASKFFVRVSGTKADNEAKVQEAFGSVTPVDAGYPGEYAFVTEEVTESSYIKAEEKLGNIINKIRFN